MQNRYRRRALPALVLLLAGCALFGKGFTTPEVSLIDLRVEALKPLEATFRVELRIINPNDLPLELSGLTCEVELNGQRFARGAVPLKARAEPYSSVVVQMQVYASVFDLAATVLDTVRRAQRGGGPQPVQYRVSGRADLKAGRWQVPSFAFATEGRIDLKGLARP